MILNTTTDLLRKQTVIERIDFEINRDVNQKKVFDGYTKEWWDDYKAIRDSHRKRVIPIFVETDDRDFM